MGGSRPERERLAGGEGDPLAFKHELARRLVERFNPGRGRARRRAHFERVITRKQVPEDVPETAIDVGEGG